MLPSTYILKNQRQGGLKSRARIIREIKLSIFFFNIDLFIILIYWAIILILPLFKFVLKLEQEDIEDLEGQTFHDGIQIEIWIKEQYYGQRVVRLMLHDVITRIRFHLGKSFAECYFCIWVIIILIWVHLFILFAH